MTEISLWDVIEAVQEESESDLEAVAALLDLLLRDDAELPVAA
jgi:hypothetical protein